METEVPPGFEIPNTPGLPDDFANVFEVFNGDDGSNTITVDLTGETVVGAVFLSLLANRGPAGVASDGAQDTLIVNGAGLGDDTVVEGEAIDGRAVVAFGFGPQDTLEINGVSGSDAQVLLFSEEELPTVPNDLFLSGAVISLGNGGVISLSNSGSEPFASQADFNQRVTFGEGGTPSFDNLGSIDDILGEFERTGELPPTEIPGVFELPDDPQPGDTVDLPPITITIGGEEVTFDPGDPFWFDNMPAEAREAFLADPEIAVGYDYRLIEPATGQAFATVEPLTVGGDNSYDLVVFGPDGTAQAERTVEANTVVDFEAEYDFPVTNFVLSGIDPEANLDPDDPQAFPLLMSFVQSGGVDMQQTPLVRGFEFKVDDDGDYPDLAAAFYVGYYGRAAEPGGLTFWSEFIEGRVVGGQSVDELIQEISARFADENETAELYPFLGAARDGGADPEEADAFVNQVYQNLFNRPAEQAGEDYWSDLLVTRTANGQSIADIIVSFVNGAQGNDAVAIGNKIDVASQFGRAFTDDEFADLDFDLAELIAGIDATDASVDAAEQEIEAAGGALPETTALVGASETQEGLLT